MSAELRTARSRAMGSEIVITTTASPIAIQTAQAAIGRLEQNWSRFRADSEICAANAASGPSLVRPSTARIIEVALAGRRSTDGWFDPTQGSAASAAGYRHSLDRGWAAATICPEPDGDVTVDGDTGLLHLPPGLRSIWAGSLRVGRRSRRVDSARQRRRVHRRERWRRHSRPRLDRSLVEIESPSGSLRTPMVIGIKDGGVAMSGPTKRRSPDGRHHLIDPFTRQPARHPRTAIVVAAATAGAEILATAAAIAPISVATDIVGRAGATAWLIEADGAVATIGSPGRFLLDPGWLDPSRNARTSTRESTA